MRVEFNFPANNLVSFDMELEILMYEESFNFSSLPGGNLSNIDAIKHRFQIIDDTKNVMFRSLNPLRYRYVEIWHNVLLPEIILLSSWTPEDYPSKEVEVKIDGTMYDYGTCKTLCWFPDDRKIPYQISLLLNQHCKAMEQVLLGTVKHYLPTLKAEAKAAVVSKAVQSTHTMTSNAEAILEFLSK